MTPISWFVLASTVVGLIAMAIGIIAPANAMGKAICTALESLARQPEAEKSLSRTLFIGLAMKSVRESDLLSGHCVDCAVP